MAAAGMAAASCVTVTPDELPTQLGVTLTAMNHFKVPT
jgi:hypothetical protein